MCSQVQEDETYAVTVNRGMLSLHGVKFNPSHLLLIYAINFLMWEGFAIPALTYLDCRLE